MKINYNETRKSFDLCAVGTESYKCWVSDWQPPFSVNEYFVGELAWELACDICSEVEYYIPLLENKHGKTDEEIQQDLFDDSVYLAEYLTEFIFENMKDNDEEIEE